MCGVWLPRIFLQVFMFQFYVLRPTSTLEESENNSFNIALETQIDNK